MLERDYERKFVARVRALGGMTLKLAPTTAGAPDRLVILPGGRIELVELKAPGGRLRPVQEVWHRKAAARGVRVRVLTGEEVESYGGSDEEAGLRNTRGV